MSLPGQMPRSQAMSAPVIAGSNTFVSRSPTVPPVEESDANSSGLVVSRLPHHLGYMAMPASVPRVS